MAAKANSSSVTSSQNQNNESSNKKSAIFQILFFFPHSTSPYSLIACSKNVNLVGKVSTNFRSSKIVASISITFFFEQVQSASLTIRSAWGVQIYSYFALMNRQARARSCRFYRQSWRPLRLLCLQFWRIWSKRRMQWKRVQGFRDSLWQSYSSHRTTSSRIQELMGRSEEISEMAFGAFDFRQSLIVTAFGLASVLSVILFFASSFLPSSLTASRTISLFKIFCELFLTEHFPLPSP